MEEAAETPVKSKPDAILENQEITHSRERLAALAAKRLSEVDESRIRILIGSKEIVLKDPVDKVVNAVLAAKDFVSSALTTQPMATLAWTGVCILLPVSCISNVIILFFRRHSKTTFAAGHKLFNAIRRCKNRPA